MSVIKHGPTAPSSHISSVALRQMAAFAVLVAAAVHVPVTAHHLDEAPYMGVLFVALVTACALLAGGLVLTRELIVHLVAALICAAAIAGYVLTRAVAFPMLAHDVGHWLDPLGLAAISSEGVVVATYVAVVARRRGATSRRGPADDRAGGLLEGRLLIRGVAAVGLAALVVWLLAPDQGVQKASNADGHSATEVGGHGGHQHDETTTPAIDDADSPDLAVQLDAARIAAERWPTAADALADGWTLAEDYASQVGAHFMRYAEIDSVFDAARPEMLLYGGDALNSPIVGVAYYVVDREPDGFVGEADIWHQHPNVCIGPDGPLWGADGVGICAATDDVPVGNWAWMLHAWVIPDWASPQGVFSTVNLALP